DMTYSPDKSRGSAWAGTNKPINSAAAAAPLNTLRIIISPCQYCIGGTTQRATRYGHDHDLAITNVRVGSAQLIVAPPSITRVWPVMKSPALDPMNTAAPAISSGMPMRRSGEREVEAFRFSGLSHSALAKSVLIRPGAMQFTRILCLPYSQARLRASCMSAALEIA